MFILKNLLSALILPPFGPLLLIGLGLLLMKYRPRSGKLLAWSGLILASWSKPAQKYGNGAGKAVVILSCFLRRKCTIRGFYDSLRTKYLGNAHSKVRTLLSSKQAVDYDQLWAVALATPLVWVEDLNQFLAELKRDGKLKFIGVSEREKFPKHGKGAVVQLI